MVHAHGIDAIASVLRSICNLQQALADAEHKVSSTALNVAAHAGYGAEHALMRFDAPNEKTGRQWLGFF